MTTSLDSSSCSRYVFKVPALRSLNSSSLIAATVIAVNHAHHLRYCFSNCQDYKIGSKYYKGFKKLQANPSYKPALKLLKNQVFSVLEDLDLPLSGPYDLEDTIPKLTEYFDTKIRILDRGGSRILYTCPENKKLGQGSEINLLMTQKDGKNRLDVITNLNLYVKPFGLFCHICNRILTKKSHKCSNSAACYACGRAKLEYSDVLFETSFSQALFCREDPGKWNTCSRCGMTTRSKKCGKIHSRKKSNNCYHRKKCELCSRVYVVKKDRVHTCQEERFCQLCFSYYNPKPNEQHYCRLREQKPPKYYPPIGAWDLESKASSNSPNMCFECIYQQKRYLERTKCVWSQLNQDEKRSLLCPNHKDSNPDEKSFHSGDCLLTFIQG